MIESQTHYKVVEPVYLKVNQLRARAALGAAAETSPGGYFGERSRLLRSAARLAQKLERENLQWTTPLAKLLRAGVANIRGDTDTAVHTLAEAATGFDAADMAMYAAAARRQRGRLLGGDKGRDLIRQADAFMTSEGVVDPDRIAAMLAPGFPD